MKAVLVGMLALAMLAVAAPQSPVECLSFINCLEPRQHDLKALPSCNNCADRYCPEPGPGGPIIPVGEVWGWNQATDSCGPVLPGDQCAGLDVTCVSGYSYRWNGVDTCQCLPLDTKRTPATPVCRIECIPPSSHDPNAIPTTCNCDEKNCPPPSGPGGPNIPAGETFAFNATSDECGPVLDPNAECQSLGVECVGGDLSSPGLHYVYGWDPTTYSCKCLEIFINKRSPVPVICDIACIPPEARDPHASSPGCNCAERVCPPSNPPCPVNLVEGWDEEANECGCVASPEAECVATGFTCLAGYMYGWNAADSRCQCLAN